MATMNVANASAGPGDGESQLQQTQESLVSNEISKFWGESTHKYLYLSSSPTIDKIIGIVVILSQFAIYGCIFASEEPDYDIRTLYTTVESCNGENESVNDISNTAMKFKG